MKQKVILLMILALGMCFNNVDGQTKKPVRKTTTQTKDKPSPIVKDSREYQIGEDGFEWYKVCKNGKYGAEDKSGNIMVPIEYDQIDYNYYDTSRGMCYAGAGFSARIKNFYSYYLRNGKCVIPFTRKYTKIGKITRIENAYRTNKKHDFNYGTYYICRGENRCAICDVNGKEIFSMENCVYLSPSDYDGRYYFHFETKEGGHGIADANGNVIIKPVINYIFDCVDGVFITSNDKVVGYISSINTTRNILANNPKEDPNSLGDISSSSSASSNSSSSSSNSGNSTTTIHVEHHHDPMPVQQWQACFACGGMGTMGCDNCGGSGTKYIGDRLYTCSRCNGQRIIPCNICYGNKGQYITVYR